MTKAQLDRGLPSAVREFRLMVRQVAIPASAASHSELFEAAYRAGAMRGALDALRSGKPAVAEALLNIEFTQENNDGCE